MSRQTDFINSIKDGAIAGLKQYGILASLTISQAILESGWGQHAPHNNLFGIKAGTNWTGKTFTMATREYSNGKSVIVNSTFRAYNSIAESVKDHACLLSTLPRYSNLKNCTDCYTACKLVKDDGYATDPSYTEKLYGIIKTYNLSQYDNINAQNDTVYIVKSGDTLSRIASKYGTNYQHLATVNGISNPNRIYPGQKIVIK
jgi:lysozyme